MRRIFVTLLLMLSMVAASVTARTVQAAAANGPTALAFLQNVNATLHYSAASAFSSFTYTQVSNLGASGDRYLVTAYDSNSNFLQTKTKWQVDLTQFYDAHCDNGNGGTHPCYLVPLTSIGFSTGTLNALASIVVSHQVAGSCQGGYCTTESIVEILN